MKRLYRDRYNRKIAGICGGLGQYFHVDPTLVRLLLLILLIATVGIVLLIYCIGWFIIPEGPRAYVQISSKHLYRSKKNRMIGGVVGGLAEFFSLDPTLLRLIVATLCIITGLFPVTIIYFLSLFVIPERNQSQS